MLLSIHPLFYALTLTIGLVPVATATKSYPSAKPSATFSRKLTQGLSNKPSCARSFTSTAAQNLGDLSQNQFRDNMTATIESHLTPALLQELHKFWFEHLDNADQLIVADQSAHKRWYMGGAELDQECVTRFGPTLEALRASGVKTGDDILRAVQPSDPFDWLSLVLLLDQIPRNCYRGASASVVFSYFDPLARDIALAATERGIPDGEPQIRWQFTYRSWFFLPLMHSENLADHEKATKEYTLIAQDMHSLSDTATVSYDKYRARAAKVVQKDVDAANALAQLSIDFEKKHYDIIKRFGRYPHRNEALGREYTVEEKEYLESGGETFGDKAS